MMTTTDILIELERLPLSERAAVLGAALRSLHEALNKDIDLDPDLLDENDRELAKQARIAQWDYLNDPELTAFTALDGEDFLEME